MKKKVFLFGLILISGLLISKTSNAKVIGTYTDGCNFIDGYVIEYDTLAQNKHYTSGSATTYKNLPKSDILGNATGKFYINYYDSNNQLVCQTDSASGYSTVKSEEYTYMTIKWQMEKYVDMPIMNLGMWIEVCSNQSATMTYQNLESEIKTSTSNSCKELSSTMSAEVKAEYFETSAKIGGEISTKDSKMIENSQSVSIPKGFEYSYTINNTSNINLNFRFQMRAFYTPYIIEYFKLEPNSDEVYQYLGYEYKFQYIDSSDFLSCKGFTLKDGKYMIYETYKSHNYAYFD